MSVLSKTLEIGSNCAAHNAAELSLSTNLKPPLKRRQFLLANGGFKFVLWLSSAVLRASQVEPISGFLLTTPRSRNTKICLIIPECLQYNNAVKKSLV